MSEPRTYYYETEIEWKHDAEGSVGAGGLAPIEIGAPPEFDGRAGVWSPEHLFVAALNGCYMLTFLAMARFSRIEVLGFSSTATGSWRKRQAEPIRSPRWS